MKSRFIISALAFVAGLIVYSCGDSTAQVQGNTGADIYNNNCVVCHGTDGKAGLTGASDLSVSTLTHEAAADVVMHGRNGMRAFSELTKEEIEAVVTHIETLRKK